MKNGNVSHTRWVQISFVCAIETQPTKNFLPMQWFVVQILYYKQWIMNKQQEQKIACELAENWCGLKHVVHNRQHRAIRIKQNVTFSTWIFRFPVLLRTYFGHTHGIPKIWSVAKRCSILILSRTRIRNSTELQFHLYIYVIIRGIVDDSRNPDANRFECNFFSLDIKSRGKSLK